MDFIDATVRIPKEPYLTAPQVCSLFKVEDRTLRRWIAAGQFPRPGPGRVWSNWAVFAAILWRELGPKPNDGGDEAEVEADGEGGEDGADDGENTLAARPK